MQKLPVPSRPTYLVKSVDNALGLLQMLRDHGRVKLTQAAAELGVSDSTAHRLLAMLAYRGFAIQDESRSYLPGPSLGAGPSRMAWTRELTQVAIPHLRALCKRTGETVNLIIRVGSMIHFLWSEEGSSKSRIISRKGIVLPARAAAGGKILLSELSEMRLRELYQGPAARLEGEYLAEEEFRKFVHALRRDGRNGYSTANAETERGVGALAMPVRDEGEHMIAAFAIAVPVTRAPALFVPEMLEVARATRSAIEHDLREAGVSSMSITLR